jgi:gas vesicle protein
MRRSAVSNNIFKLNYFVVGLALGILGGILFAPRRGEEIREDMRRRTHEGIDYLNHQAEKLRDTTEKVVNKTRDWMSRRNESWQSTAENGGAKDEETPTM